MTCPACAQAAAELSHLFHAGCAGCRARMVARSPAAADARRGGVQTSAYRALLVSRGVTHEQAKAAYQADYLSRRPT